MAGWFHSTLLRSDGCVVAFGRSDCRDLKSEFSPETPGQRYVDSAAGLYHSLLLNSDGTVKAIGCNGVGQCSIPELPQGLRYVEVSASEYHSVVLRSDGQAFAFGNNFWGQCDLPKLRPGQSYLAVSAGMRHSLLLRNDGIVVACGQSDDGRCEFARPPDGLRYTAVSAGGRHSLALRSDGEVVAVGFSLEGATSVPPLPAGQIYVAVSAGGCHSVLLRSDGQAVAFGSDCQGQCALPELPPGLKYLHVDAGYRHTLLLQSDGQALAVGWSLEGQCDVPPLPPNIMYIGPQLGLIAIAPETVSQVPNSTCEAASPDPPRPLLVEGADCRNCSDGRREHFEYATPTTAAPGSPHQMSEPLFGSPRSDVNHSGSLWHRDIFMQTSFRDSGGARELTVYKDEPPRSEVSSSSGVPAGSRSEREDRWFQQQKDQYQQQQQLLQERLQYRQYQQQRQQLLQQPAHRQYQASAGGEEDGYSQHQYRCANNYEGNASPWQASPSPSSSRSRARPKSAGKPQVAYRGVSPYPTSRRPQSPGRTSMGKAAAPRSPGLARGRSSFEEKSWSAAARCLSRGGASREHLLRAFEVETPGWVARGPAAGHGRTFFGSRQPEQVPHDFLQESGGLIHDWAPELRTALNRGGTFMSSASMASPHQQPHDQLQETGGVIPCLSEITRPNLQEGGTFMSSAGDPLGGVPHDFLQEYGGRVHDLSDITRPELWYGGTFMSSAGQPLGGVPHDQLQEYGGRIESIGDILRPALKYDVGTPFHQLSLGSSLRGASSSSTARLPQEVSSERLRMEGSPEVAEPTERSPKWWTSGATPCSPNGTALPKAMNWRRRCRLLQTAISQHVGRAHESKVKPYLEDEGVQ